MGYLCGYKINKVIIYPFGGITKTNTLINSPLKKDLIVFVGGFIFQILLLFLFFLLYKNSLIQSELYYLFKKYNTFIFLFNLIPIIPLDGYLILNILFNKIFPYYKSLWLSLIVSILSIILFLCFYKNNYVIILFLLFNIINYLKNINSLYNCFILERYLYDFPYYKIKYFKDMNLKKLSKECYCYFKEEKGYINEKKLLNKKFDNIQSF